MTFKAKRAELQRKLLSAKAADVPSLALEVFQWQATHNSLYKSYLELIGCVPTRIQHVRDIPYLPISLFKNYQIQTGQWSAEQVFSSSGTTGSKTSRHYIRDIQWYHQVARQSFERAYGPLSQYCFLGLLPSYLERSGSSLIYMVDYFIQQSKYDQSGFFLYNTDSLLEIVGFCQKRQIPTVLIGVSFALLDLAEQHQPDLSGLIVMETGGMKGRRREMTREELHGQLKTAFSLEHIHSEYGMTELLSQAYSPGEGIFWPGPLMQIQTAEITDPFAIQKYGKTGIIQVMDLGNLDSISFIATEDLGRVHENGSFEILGRHDASDIRGCNLLIA
ncbi:MAG: acyl transferase [Saprospiraceae bacterium]|nr:acyl transferase [Saprospiraceae bacterium]